MRAYKIFSYKGANYRIASSAYEIIVDELKRLRASLEVYIDTHREFEASLVPVAVKAHAPEVACIMAEAGRAAGVGPMAAVAGAFAELAARKALEAGADEAIIENGGDIFLASKQEVIVGLYAGPGPLSKRLAFRILPANMPLSLCSSSSSMGHSLSLGNCDLATVVAKNAALADAAATLACNSVHTQADISGVIGRVQTIPGILGLLIVKDDKVGMAGWLPELIPHTDAILAEKVTRDKGNREFIRLE
jgi:ApbE superfamily uncharacterized protein (UPF0280 family)